MNRAVVQRILGVLLILFSLTMLPPVAVSLFYRDGNWQPFAEAFFGLIREQAGGAARGRRRLGILDSSLPGGLLEGSGEIRYAQTMSFTTIVFFSLFTVFAARSDEQSAFVGCSRISGSGQPYCWRSFYRQASSTFHSCSRLSRRRRSARVTG